MINDISNFWGGDLGLSSTGDLQPVSGTLRGQQRVLRRLLTNPTIKDSFGNITVSGDYIFHGDYGAGLPAQVGQTLSIPKITAIIRTQMMLEDAVAKNPEPQISVVEIAGGINVNIQYQDAATKQAVVLNFNVAA